MLIGPWRGSDGIEYLQCRPQLLACAHALAGATEAGAEGESCPRRLEHVGRLRMELERGGELRL